jgi:PAS domain-containing protein
MSHSQKQISDMTRSGLNLIKQAISIYDQNLELVIANRRFGEMFELPHRLTTEGATFFETVKYLAERGDYGPIDDVDAFMKERVDQARAFSAHYFERDRDNGTRISVEGSPLRQGGWVTVYTDITETRNQEEILRGRSDDLTEKLVKQT